MVMKEKLHIYDWSAMKDVRVTSCSAILGHFLFVCGNRYHTLVFKDKDNRKAVLYSKQKELSNCYLGFFLYLENFENFKIFQLFFLFLQKISRKMSKLKRFLGTLEWSPMNVCSKFLSSNSLQKCRF